MSISIRLLCEVVLASMLIAQSGWADTSVEKTLYTKTLPGGREFVFVQEPIISIAGIRDLFSLPNSEKATHFFWLRLDFKLSQKSSITIWKQLYSLEDDSQFDEFGVLDVLVLSNRLSVALAKPRSSIVMVDIGLMGGETQYSSLLQWSQIAVDIGYKPGRLSAQIGFNQQEHQMQVEIIDKLQDNEQHTVFFHDGDRWSPYPVKQWQKTVPSSQPSK